MILIDKKTGIITRKLYRNDYPWLDKDIQAGTVVYEFPDIWRCATPEGVTVSMQYGGFPYFEVPKDSVIWDS